ncbi:hypothetical protein D5F01_LYC01220 [Larimichthys crocea]|uniref:HAT C-terminal dimerisation domain-containing protein n=1 Tax=Larimichthys crocea TaxID=215358 RepID=A0A6G0JBT8_LARCR|nr:hypothetical protein D5F01_LYC01220 [Larimichthys crocea]
MGDLFSQVYQQQTRAAAYDLHGELVQYEREPQLPPDADPLLWWKSTGSARYPYIAQVAKKYLTVPGTSPYCKSIQPYSITANEGFKYLLEVLEPRYSIPDRKVFSDKLVPALYEKVKMDVVDSMSRAQRVSITVDGWTSCATDSYITVTAHYVTEEWDLQSHVLQTRVFNASHTGANLAALLQNVLREWNITDKNPALVTDNARNMVVAGAGADLTPHVRCVAHTLNLASQKALKMDRVSELLVKVRKVVTYFHKSPQAAEVLREIQSQLHLPNHKLIHDVCTRWNSSVDMLERFWEQQPALLNAMLSRRIRRGEGLAATAVNEDDMRLIQEIIKLMSPVKVATTLLSEEKSPTISMIAPIQAKLHKHFSEDNTDMPIIAEMKRRFRQDFFDRYVELQELLNSASALDPRFKDLTFLDDVDSRDLIFVKITAEVVKMNEKMKGIGALDEGGALDDGGALDEGGAAEGGGDRSPSIEERRDSHPYYPAVLRKAGLAPTTIILYMGQAISFIEYFRATPPKHSRITSGQTVVVIRELRKLHKDLNRTVLGHQALVKQAKGKKLVPREDLASAIKNLLTRSKETGYLINVMEHKTVRKFGPAQLYLEAEEYRWFRTWLRLRNRTVPTNPYFFSSLGREGHHPILSMAWVEMGLKGTPSLVDIRTTVSTYCTLTSRKARSL